MRSSHTSSLEAHSSQGCFQLDYSYTQCQLKTKQACLPAALLSMHLILSVDHSTAKCNSNCFWIFLSQVILTLGLHKQELALLLLKEESELTSGA